MALTPPEFAIYQRKKREFLHAVNTMRSHTTAAGHASSAAQGRAHAALVALRQSTCHPQVSSNLANLSI